mmetsp:Transcript_21012/g.66353  ORF Transcript_21012/g.66353 Transcript_21012/m.66353 type:complete len:210 (+) Transcript_21012:623-1252(+)
MALSTPGEHGRGTYQDDEAITNAEGCPDHTRGHSLRLQGGDHARDVVVDAEKKHRVAKDRHEVLRPPERQPMQHRRAALVSPTPCSPDARHENEEEDGCETQYHDDHCESLRLLQVREAERQRNKERANDANMVGNARVAPIADAREPHDIAGGVRKGLIHRDHECRGCAIREGEDHDVDASGHLLAAPAVEHHLPHGPELHTLADLER